MDTMTQELKLHSPAGAEPAVYSWPLPDHVSAASQVNLDGCVSLKYCCHLLLLLFMCHLSFRMEKMALMKSLIPLGMILHVKNCQNQVKGG